MTQMEPAMPKNRAQRRLRPRRSCRKNQLYIPEIPGTRVKITLVFKALVYRRDSNMHQKNPTVLALIKLYPQSRLASGSEHP